jgi:hypothetical protein
MKAKLSLQKQEAEIDIKKDEVESFFNGIIPDFVKQSGGIISDNIRLWRFSNQVNIIKKAQKIIETSGLTKQQVPLKVLIPLLDSSSLEEDSSMQEKWASLLAHVATGFNGIKANYVEILKELSPLEVYILDTMYSNAYTEGNIEKRALMQFGKAEICKSFNISNQECDLIIQNFYRLGICQPPGSSGIMFGDERVGLQTTNVFELTSLGFHFIESCK